MLGSRVVVVVVAPLKTSADHFSPAEGGTVDVVVVVVAVGEKAATVAAAVVVNGFFEL